MTIALVQVVVAGGSPTRGYVSVSAAQTIALSGTNTTGWNANIWEIYSYPAGFAPGGSWTLESDSYTWQNGKVTPDTFSTGTIPGKWQIRLRVNGNPLARNPDGSPNALYVSALTDESTGLNFTFPGGIVDLGYLESNQFSALGWAGGQQSNARIVGNTLLGSGTTGARPTATRIGAQYFDTTLDIPVWWNGTNWKNASGTTV